MTVATDRLRALVVRLPAVSWRAAALAFVALMVAFPALAVAGAAGLGAMHESRMLPGVSVAGVDVAGLDRPAAEALVSERLPSLSEGRLTVTAGDERLDIPYVAFGRDYAMDAMLDEAFAVGRSGTILDSTLGTLQTLAGGTSVPAAVTYDAAELERLISEAATALIREPREASVTLAESGRFEVTAGEKGRRVDADAAMAAATGAVESLSPGDVTIRLRATDVSPRLTTEMARDAAAVANAMSAADLTLVAGEDEFTIKARKIAGWLELGFNSNDRYAVSVVTERVEAAVAELAAEVDRAPVDAGYVVEGAGIAVTPAVVGRELDVEATVTRITQALDALRDGTSSAPADVQLAVSETQPALTTEAAQAAAPQMTVISSWTTYFTPNPGDFFGENIAVPTRILDGHVVAPGAWFDFWSGIGPVTEERGYGPGGAIINGRSVPTGALGGGICSTSTTLFNAAARAGLEIGERTNHYYYIPRYPTGLDATVAIVGDAVTNMSFRNDTPYPIIIRGYYSYGVVTFELVSVPTGRTTSFSEPQIWNRQTAKDEIEYTDELAPGVQERVEYPHDGFEVNVTRTVTDASGAIIHQETYYSNYRVVNGIIREGEPDPDAEADPSPSPSPSPSPAP